MKNVVIAGGTGFIGQNLVKKLESNGHNVIVLSRSQGRESKTVQWDPKNSVVSADKLKDTQVLINLCGSGITDKRWTNSRKRELISSRVDVTHSLFELAKHMTKLEHYISASGINAYGFDNGIVEHVETDAYGDDFVSQLVRKWEAAADEFKEIVPVTKLRIAIVLAEDGGALEKLKIPLKFGVKGVMSSGKQQIPWVHISDLVSLFSFVLENRKEGVYNTNAGNCSNEELMTSIATQRNKSIWLSKIPSFIMKAVLGQAAVIVLSGAKASNQKIKNEGFIFQCNQLDKALHQLD